MLIISFANNCKILAQYCILMTGIYHGRNSQLRSRWLTSVYSQQEEKNTRMECAVKAADSFICCEHQNYHNSHCL